MDTIKASIFVACILGIVSTFFTSISPKGSIKKYFSILISAVTLITVIIPYTDNSFKITLNENKFESLSSYSYKTIENRTDEIILQKSSEKVVDYFYDRLKRNNISVKDINIKIELNEYNEIEIKKIILTGLSESDKDEAQKIIKDDLPETDVIFLTEDYSDNQNE